VPPLGDSFGAAIKNEEAPKADAGADDRLRFTLTMLRKKHSAVFAAPLVRMQPCLRRLSVRCVSQWTNSAIRMTMGMGMPSIKSKIERIVSILNQFEITSGPILGSSATLANAIGLRGRANR
jgi:hypothetical protein